MTRTKNTQVCVYAREGVPLRRWDSLLKSKKLRIEFKSIVGGMSMKEARLELSEYENFLKIDSLGFSA